MTRSVSVSYRSSVGQGKFAGQRPSFYRCATDYVAVYTLAAGRSCNDMHVSLKCAVQSDGGGAYVL